MRTISLNTIIPDSMYMDILSVEMSLDEIKLKEQVKKARKILEGNVGFNAISLTTEGISLSIKCFDNFIDDVTKSENCGCTLDTRIIIITEHSVCFRGYNKYSSDFLEVYLDCFLMDKGLFLAHVKYPDNPIPTEGIIAINMDEDVEIDEDILFYFESFDEAEKYKLVGDQEFVLLHYEPYE